MFWTAIERENYWVCYQYNEKLSGNQKCKVKFGLTLWFVYVPCWPDGYCVEEWCVGHVV